MGSVAIDKVDLIVLGATGFTGKRTIKNLVQLTNGNYTPKFTWGIAARSKEKIENLLSELEEIGEEKTKIPVFECDITKDDITNVTRRARILLNCTGPNTVLSEPIVKACIDTRTHYVDISAELYHMINLYRTFHKSAEEANVLVVPACGFAVIPALSGMILMEKNFNGTLTSVEGYVEITLPKRAYFPGPNKCLVHYGTWASLVYEMQNMQEVQRLKAETYPEEIYEPMPQEMKRSFFHRNEGKVWYPYPGPDETVVEMSQRYLHKKKGRKPYHCKMYTTTPWFHTIIVIPLIFIYYYLCYLNCFKHLLWKYPRFFTLGYISHKGPSEKMAMDTKFEFTLKGKGLDKDSKEKSSIVKIAGCDPGYETTSKTLIAAALTILTESVNIPKGGVVSVGAAFHDTKLVENIIKIEGLAYEIVDNDKIDKI